VIDLALLMIDANLLSRHRRSIGLENTGIVIYMLAVAYYVIGNCAAIFGFWRGRFGRSALAWSVSSCGTRSIGFFWTRRADLNR
jgi:hypothetical protein